jgi:glutamate 5-kinase
VNHLARKQSLLKRARRVVVKIGSSLLSTPDGLDPRRIRSLAREVEELGKAGLEFILVTSGAVAAGGARMRLRERPKTIPQKQAAAAVGQIDLMAAYKECFETRGRHVAQILLTRDDLSNRRRYLNAKHAIAALLEAGVRPIVNENDTVAVDEIKLGDNDNLSAAVAALVEADLLVILSDVDGLYTSDPRRDASATPVPVVAADDPQADRYASASAGRLGTGGMATKVEAARKAAAAGISTIIADGRDEHSLRRVLDPATVAGTLVVPATDRLGVLHLDAGAAAALREKGRSLLPSGVTLVEGTFGGGDCVRCLAPDGAEIARGLVNYSSAELRRIQGAHSRDIDRILGYKICDEVIHRNDMVIA